LSLAFLELGFTRFLEYASPRGLRSSLESYWTSIHQANSWWLDNSSAMHTRRAQKHLVYIHEGKPSVGPNCKATVFDPLRWLDLIIASFGVPSL